ncbi:glycoside hydrolase family 75 protein [Microcoleus sp. S13C4]|uniref:glycoside hydrolase family 75 protein n=1 Tax=Microcoleus sp. S13C4 TaxID=3055410 RepID=UPI002FD04AD0
MSPTDVKFSQISGVAVHYDRDRPEDYGTRGRSLQFFAEQQFYDELELCFDELWTICPLGKPEVIASAGTFVPENPGLHGDGRAFDLDGIFWSNRSFVTFDDGFRGGDKKFYFGINAVFQKHFGVVLNYLFNTDHRDHFHIDDSSPVGFDSGARNKVTFVQGALVHVMGISIGSGNLPDPDDIDGDYGPNTDRGVSQALSALSISGSLRSKSVWLNFLNAIARKAFGASAPIARAITVTTPTEGQQFSLGDTVAFTGTAETGIETVKLLAENRFDLGGEVAVAAGNWAVPYKFTQGGQRKIIVKGFDKDGTQVANSERTILLINQPNAPGYSPPTASVSRLGSIPSLLSSATQVTQTFLGGKVIFRLPSGQLYIDGDMDIDADGSPRARELDPCCGQTETSLRYSDRQSVNAENIPYFVLPGGFFQSRGIRLGDIAAVIYKSRIEYAVLADIGPTNKIGEGSITLSRSLGNEPLVNGIVQSGIDEDVIYIIFPGSGDGTPQTVDLIRAKGQALFAALGGKP